MLTERRTLIPVKITAAGWDTYLKVKISDPNDFNPELLWTYQTNTASNDSRKCAEDIDCGIQPLCQFVISGTRLVESGNLFVKYTEDGVWRMTGLEFVEERMGAEIFLCLLLVSFDGAVEYGLIVRG